MIPRSFYPARGPSGPAVQRRESGSAARVGTRPWVGVATIERVFETHARPHVRGRGPAPSPPLHGSRQAEAAGVTDAKEIARASTSTGADRPGSPDRTGPDDAAPVRSDRRPGLRAGRDMHLSRLQRAGVPVRPRPRRRPTTRRRVRQRRSQPRRALPAPSGPARPGRLASRAARRRHGALDRAERAHVRTAGAASRRMTHSGELRPRSPGERSLVTSFGYIGTVLGRASGVLAALPPPPTR